MRMSSMMMANGIKKGKVMEINFIGYKTWKNIKEQLGMYWFYIMPSIVVHYDNSFMPKEFPLEIKFAWLFWEMNIHLKWGKSDETLD